MKIALAGDEYLEALAPQLGALLGSSVAMVDWRAGARTRDFTNLADRARQAGATTAFLVIGSADTATPAYAAELRALVASLRAAGVSKIVWWGPAYAAWSNIDSRRVAVARAQTATLAALGVDWHDSRPLTGALASDGLHLSPEALDRWAARIAAFGRDPLVPVIAVGVVAVALAVLVGAVTHRPKRADRLERELAGLDYPPQPCGLDYEKFRSGWKYAEAYEMIAWRPESKGVSQRAVLRQMKKLKQSEYEQYVSDCEHGGDVVDFEVDPADYMDGLRR